MTGHEKWPKFKGETTSKTEKSVQSSLYFSRDYFLSSASKYWFIGKYMSFFLVSTFSSE